MYRICTNRLFLPFGKKNVGAFYYQDKKDLSDSVERLKIYSQLRLTPPTVKRSCHMIFTGQMEGSKLKARDSWDLQYNILRAISFVFSSGLYLIEIIIFIQHKNIKRTKKNHIVIAFVTIIPISRRRRR